MVSRSQKAFLSTFFSFLLEIVKVISALILPRLFIAFFGSEVNGIIQSIAKFLGYISLLQLGVGGVIRAAMYKPLAEHDTVQLSKVVKTGDNFFKKIARISVIYIFLLALIYPFFGNSGFDYWFVFFLVIIAGIDITAQYFLAFPYRSLVIADQRSYFFDFIQIITIFINLFVTIYLVYAGCSIHVIKLVGALIFVLQPIALKIFCDKKYKIIKKIEVEENILKQRWSAAGHSLADFVHRNTDIFILTLFSTYTNVSIYSVYSVVTNGLNAVVLMGTNSFGAALGDMLAKDEKKPLNDTMSIFIFLIHSISIVAFSTALCVIIPFVKLYTSGITDVNYVNFGFAIVILLAEMLACLRQPYQAIITSAGHFKETQNGAFIEAIINIVISLLLIRKYGLFGIAIGTLAGMIYRTIYLIWYLRNNILYLSYKYTLKRYFISFMITFISCFIISLFKFTISSFYAWILVSAGIVCFSFFLVIIISFVFYKKETLLTLEKVKNLFNLGNKERKI